MVEKKSKRKGKDDVEEDPAEDAKEEDVSQVDRSFWFFREGDEEFEGNLTSYNTDEATRVSQEYHEFLASSAHLSLKSFVDPRTSTALHTSIALQKAQKYGELVPVLGEKVSWPRFFWNHKFVILTMMAAVMCALVLSLYTVPVSQLNNRESQCEVSKFTVLDVVCDNESQSAGYCIQQEVTTTLVQDGAQIKLIGILQGFPKVKALGAGQEFECALTNCVSEDNSIDLNNLNIDCETFLAEENRTADSLSDGELAGCNSLGSFSTCIRVTNKDSETKKRYYKEELADSGNGEILSLINHPDKSSASIAAILAFSVFGVLIVAAVWNEKKLREDTLKRAKELHERLLMEMKKGISPFSPTQPHSTDQIVDLAKQNQKAGINNRLNF